MDATLTQYSFLTNASEYYLNMTRVKFSGDPGICFCEIREMLCIMDDWLSAWY